MIYILEDDESIRNFVSYALNSSGLEAQGFGLPSEFWQAVEKSIPSLVLLDIMLPEQDGLSVLSHLRADAATRDIPVIMLTAKGSEYDRVLGLDLIKKGEAQRGEEKKDEEQSGVSEELLSYINGMIEARKAAKKAKDFAEADRIRDELLSKGITLVDTREGTKFTIS